MEEKPNYYAIIPAEVRYDNDLRAGAKIFYGEITALCSKYGVCTASNNYFAELYQMTPSGITHWVSQLKNKGYISVEYEKEGREIKKRKIIITPFNSSNLVVDRVLTNVNRVLTKVGEGTDKSSTGYLQKDKENNTSNNNTSNNNKRYFADDELDALFKDYLDLRKKIKAVNSDRAIKGLLNKLEPYSDSIKKRMIEESIVNSWKSVFPLKDNERSKPQDFKRPSWLDMDL